MRHWRETSQQTANKPCSYHELLAKGKGETVRARLKEARSKLTSRRTEIA
ncbi:hypothetical protein WDW89_03600 [Deltaproteobacteria bacterium TL4]